MASTYKAYLGEGLGSPGEWLKTFHIPHPGRVVGRAVLHLSMPAVLDWVLGGFNGHLQRARASACRVEDRLKVRVRACARARPRVLGAGGGGRGGLGGGALVGAAFVVGRRQHQMRAAGAFPARRCTHMVYTQTRARACGEATARHTTHTCAPAAPPPTPQVFSEADFETFMRDDDTILRSAHARWMLLSERDPTCASADATSCCEAKGIYITQAPAAVGGGAAGSAAAVPCEGGAAAAGNGKRGSSSGGGGGGGGAAAAAASELSPSQAPALLVAAPGVAAEHARVWRDERGDCWVQDLPGSSGTWVNGRLLHRGDKARLLPQVSAARARVEEGRVCAAAVVCVRHHLPPWCVRQMRCAAHTRC
jgi:hypothetical protein